jgi:2TM family of unknown function (DUF5676)
MHNLNVWRVGSATALTAAIVSITCAVAVYFFPDGTVDFANSWTHGLDLTTLRSDKPWSVGGLTYGLFSVTLTGFLVGALFAWAYNLVGRARSA